mmetsp:Transcript_254/g.228  ORF Transcript_254/g.228 Transcript_254/m.228 type:complete len:137 (+) Transcript_254:1077-1487(+)
MGMSIYQQFTMKYLDDFDSPDWKNQGTEMKKSISAKEYISLMDSKDPKRLTLKKIRRSFLKDKVFIGVDTFLNVRGGISVMYIQKDTDIKSLGLPDSLEIEETVTHNKDYISYFLAKSDETTVKDVKNIPPQAQVK